MQDMKHPVQSQDEHQVVLCQNVISKCNFKFGKQKKILNFNCKNVVIVIQPAKIVVAI